MFEWIVGLLVALVLGDVVTRSFLAIVRRSMTMPERRSARIPGWLTGSVERLFFATLIGFDLAAGISAAMVAWIGIKMASNWNMLQNEESRAPAFSALLAGAYFPCSSPRSAG